MGNKKEQAATANRTARQAQTFTYFIQSVFGGPIKIGKGDPDARLECLQVGHPVPLRVLSRIEGDREAEFHEMFRELHVRGEWFRNELALALFLSERPDVPKWLGRDVVEDAKAECEVVRAQRRLYSLTEDERRLIGFPFCYFEVRPVIGGQLPPRDRKWVTERFTETVGEVILALAELGYREVIFLGSEIARCARLFRRRARFSERVCEKCGCACRENRSGAAWAAMNGSEHVEERLSALCAQYRAPPGVDPIDWLRSILDDRASGISPP